MTDTIEGTHQAAGTLDLQHEMFAIKPVRAKLRRIHPNEKIKVVEMLENGDSCDEIANEIHTSASSVSKIKVEIFGKATYSEIAAFDSDAKAAAITRARQLYKGETNSATAASELIETTDLVANPFGDAAKQFDRIARENAGLKIQIEDLKRVRFSGRTLGLAAHTVAQQLGKNDKRSFRTFYLSDKNFCLFQEWCGKQEDPSAILDALLEAFLGQVLQQQ